MNVRLSPLAALLMTLSPPALADGTTAETEGCVLGSKSDVLGGMCTGDTSLIVDAWVPALGGDCDVPLHASVATVTVRDSVQGPYPFACVALVITATS